jgi:thymidylate synthase ThyX
MGKRHITVLRYIEISIMTEGIHRGGQDDIDSHSKRFENKIIRSSTRLAEYSDNEMSDWYKGKIIPTDQALNILEIEIPESFEYMGRTYVKSPNGYVREEYKNNKDVKRGLYMLSIPSNFVSKINLCEWAHVFKERNEDGGANPEVKEWAELVMKKITGMHSQITRDYVISVQN